MLKIKDSVELKELEKYGFEEEEKQYFYYGFTDLRDDSEIRIYVEKESRLISTGTDRYTNPYEIHNKIFELFEAGLVEKVSDKECLKK